jgi:hypothetical protein
MDNRVYILPLLSILAVIVFFLRPDITGFVTATAPSSEVTANISIMINQDGFIPENALVTVYLDDRSAGMPFSEFVRRAGSGHNMLYASVPEIGYEGNGYGGVYAYSLGISAFGLDTAVTPGEHTLKIEVSYEGRVISQNNQTIAL